MQAAWPAGWHCSLWNSAERSPADALTVSPLSYSGSLPTLTVPSFREQGNFNG